MPLRPLLLATPLALALPLAASAVTLQPVPWTSAGHGNPTSLALLELGYVYCEDSTLNGCATSTGEFLVELPTGESPTLSVDTGTFAFSADVVSQVSGNTWTLGLENPSLGTPSDFFFYEFTVEAAVFAVLDIPVGDDATTEIAFTRTASGLHPNFESEILGPGSGPFFGGANTFVAGDRVTFVEVVTFGVFHSGGSAETSTLCGTSDFLDTSDCTLSMSAFQPVAGVPEPGPGLMLGAAAGLAALGRRRC